MVAYFAQRIQRVDSLNLKDCLLVAKAMVDALQETFQSFNELQMKFEDVRRDFKADGSNNNSNSGGRWSRKEPSFMPFRRFLHSELYAKVKHKENFQYVGKNIY